MSSRLVRFTFRVIKVPESDSKTSLLRESKYDIMRIPSELIFIPQA